MARVTIEDCLTQVENMYELIHVAKQRARQLYRGSEPTVRSKNRVIVTALREIADGQMTIEGRTEEAQAAFLVHQSKTKNH